MTHQTEKLEIPVGDKTLVLDVGTVGRQAAGAVLAQIGETIILSAVTCSKFPKEKASFFPLTVDYRERTYAAGRIPGGFFKREGRQRASEILTSRITDRSIRPLFPENFRREIQVSGLALSSDCQNGTDILFMVGTSLALALSNIPWSGPIGALRIGRVEDRFVLNPTLQEREASTLDLVVAGKKGAILMVESGSDEISEEMLLEALAVAQKEIDRMCELQLEFVQRFGKTKFQEVPGEIDATLQTQVEEMGRPHIAEAVRIAEKGEREEFIDKLHAEIQEKLAESFPEQKGVIKNLIDEMEYQEARRLILEEQKRTDGRRFDEIRSISCRTSFLPRAHGSALFTRGQTQALATVTLGSPSDQQIMDELEGEFKERFLLHYNFPGFSTGEPKPERGPGRREIGHGALARRALVPLLPTPEEFPYTIRVVSDIMESNGSSSMASVCGGSLALFDAGVPLKKAVAGVAMGLVKEGERTAILTDILGMEDHLGDMDFKVAGTETGVTALQMDIKIEGISVELMKEALEAARKARLSILNSMNESLSAPKPELSAYAPRMVVVTIPVDKIGALIGPGGKNIRRIIEESGANIDVEDDGKVYIASTDGPSMEMAQSMVETYTREVEVGKIYKGRVVRVMPNLGAFVEVLPGKDGLVHISQLDVARVERVEDVAKVGDTLEVKCIEIDNQGRVNLSRKAVIKPGSELENVRPQRKFDERGGRDSFRGGRRGGGRPPQRGF